MTFFILLNPKEDILKNIGNQQFLSHWLPLFFFLSIQWKTIGKQNCLVTNMLQSIFLWSAEKEMQTGLEW